MWPTGDDSRRPRKPARWPHGAEKINSRGGARVVSRNLSHSRLLLEAQVDAIHQLGVSDAALEPLWPVFADNQRLCLCLAPGDIQVFPAVN